MLVVSDELLGALLVSKLLVDGTWEPINLFFSPSPVCVHPRLPTMGHSIVPLASSPLVACMVHLPMGLVLTVGTFFSPEIGKKSHTK